MNDNNIIDNDINDLDIFENDIDMYINIFCEQNNIQDMRQASQAVWNSCLRFIYKNVFKHADLKDHNNKNNNSITITNCNRYNYNKLLDILDIYIYNMCLKYDKEVSIIGYSTLLNINTDTIYSWGNGERLSTTATEIYKKLVQFNEESLSDKLATGNKNPVGIIAILNRRHGWASPYTSDSNRQKSALSAADIRAQLAQNDQIAVEVRQIAQDNFISNTAQKDKESQ